MSETNETIVVSPDKYKTLIKGKIGEKDVAIEYQIVEINNANYMFITPPYALVPDFKDMVGKITGKWPVWNKKLESQLDIKLTAPRAWVVDSEFDDVLEETKKLAISNFDEVETDIVTDLEEMKDLDNDDPKVTAKDKLKEETKDTKPSKPKTNAKSAAKKTEPTRAIIETQKMNHEMVTKTFPELTEAIIKKYYTQGKPVDSSEIFIATQKCINMGMHPLKGGVTIYPSKNHTTGKYTLTVIPEKNEKLKIAKTHPLWDGFTAGIVVQDNEGNEKCVEGARTPTGYKLVGGWARIPLKNSNEVVYNEIDFKQYDKQGKFWGKIPELMIRKTALSQALSEAFADKLGGVYEEYEMI